MSGGLGERGMLVGRAGLAAVSALLQRGRRQHPTAGLWEAADLQWWWRTPRPTDDVPQPVWFDQHGPVAAVTVTQWRTELGVDVHVLPSSHRDDVRHVWEAALGLAVGRQTPVVACTGDDELAASLLAERGWTLADDGGASGWLEADAAPGVSPLADGYVVRSRDERSDRPHPLVERNGEAVEVRLAQTALYRPDLDLAVVTADDEVAAYALFWFDPTTSTGLVEPMRTEEPHQRRGLARHLLTLGVHRLVDLGARRIRINWEADNPASSALYPAVGFVPGQRMHVHEPPS